VISSLHVFQPKYCVHSLLSHGCYMPRPSHPPWLDHPNNINEAFKLWSFSLRSLLQPPSTSSLLGPDVLLSTLSLFCTHGFFWSRLETYQNCVWPSPLSQIQLLYEGVSKSFQTGHLERELQMVQFSATRCSCIAVLWVSLVSFTAITLCVASQRVFIVV
jgi:hypothetical protein